MAADSEELLKRPLYGRFQAALTLSQNNANQYILVFDLPPELLTTLQLKKAFSTEEPSLVEVDGQPSNHPLENDEPTTKTATSCILCSASFSNVPEQRQHVKSDWHGYNLKQKLGGRSCVTEHEFEKLVEDLDESISGSESSESDSNDDHKGSTLVTLLKKQARIAHAGSNEDGNVSKKKRGSGKAPLTWLSSPILPPNTFLGVYRALFTNPELDGEPDIPAIIRHKQHRPVPSKPLSINPSTGTQLTSTPLGPQFFLCMIGGGHFAGMIVSLVPKTHKKAGGVEERQAVIIAHKTFHRYTTRRKQGGSQSSNDSAKGAAHSAGASIRRYNEAALETDIRALLAEWRSLIEKSELVYVRANGSSNRRILFGPYDDQVLRLNDPRNRSFPFSTRRATQAELMRAFVELTRMKVSRVDEAALAAVAAAREVDRHAPSTIAQTTPSKPLPPKISKEEEEALLHTSQLQALIRRSKVPATLAYLSTNSLSPDFAFFPPTTKANYHAPSPLHLAASINSHAVILGLLTKAGANPTSLNGDGNPPFDLAGDRSTRDAFRIARFELGEERWDWDNSAHCPPPLSKADAEKRAERERIEAEKEEAARRKVEADRLKRESSLADEESKKGKGKEKKQGLVGVVEKTGAEKRELELRGLTPEVKAKLERERRARAAEERLKRMAGNGGING